MQPRDVRFVLEWASLEESALYLSYAPPAYEYGTRPFLRWVRSQGQSPTRQAVPKMPRTPLAFPFSGRLRYRTINPTPPNRVKAWEDGPLRPEVYPVMDTPERTVQHAPQPIDCAPPTGHSAPLTKKKRTVFILRSTSVRMWHKVIFRVGPVAGPNPHTTSSSKNASDPVGISLFRRPRRRVINPTPPKRVKAWGTVLWDQRFIQ